jgi:type II secretory pathway component PulM
MNFSLSSINYQALLEKFGWNRMARREQIMVAGLVILVATLLVFQLIFSPLLNSRQRLQKSVEKKQHELQQIQELQKQYRDFESKNGDIRKRISTRPKNFSLFSFIEQQANSSGIKENIEYLKPSTTEGERPLEESRVDMKLEQITLSKLVTFLKNAESTKNVVLVNRISIQEQGKNEGGISAVIQFITFKIKEESK